jgi:hypothetical protein
MLHDMPPHALKCLVNLCKKAPGFLLLCSCQKAHTHWLCSPVAFFSHSSSGCCAQLLEVCAPAQKGTGSHRLCFPIPSEIALLTSWKSAILYKQAPGPQLPCRCQKAKACSLCCPMGTGNLTLSTGNPLSCASTPILHALLFSRCQEACFPTVHRDPVLPTVPACGRVPAPLLTE